MEFREDVFFVCSTPSGLRAQQLEQVLAQLESQRILASIHPPTADVLKRIQSQKPRIVVLEYLLDAVGSAVDLLQQKMLPTDVNILIWTDEPDVEVAVTLMKLGAKDFILSDSSDSIEQLVTRISELLSRTVSSASPRREKITLIAHAEAVRTLFSQAAGWIHRPERLAVLSGPIGSGRNTFARLAQSTNPIQGPLHEIDWELSPLSTMAEAELISHLGFLLENNGIVFIDHIESSGGELLEILSNHTETILSPHSGSLILGTTRTEIASMSRKVLPDAAQFEIPPLQQRKEDIFPLLESALGLATPLPYSPTAKLRDDILELPWPGNVRQLLTATREAASRLKPATSSTVTLDPALIASNDFLTLLTQAHDRWEQHYFAKASRSIATLDLYRTYLRSGCNLVRTAAMLDTSVQHVARRITRLQQGRLKISNNERI